MARKIKAYKGNRSKMLSVRVMPEIHEWLTAKGSAADWITRKVQEEINAFEFARNQRYYQVKVNQQVVSFYKTRAFVAADFFGDKIVLFSFNEEGIPVPDRLVGQDYLLRTTSFKMQPYPVEWSINVSSDDWHLVRQYRAEVPAFGVEKQWRNTVYANVHENWLRQAPYTSFYEVEYDYSGVNWGAHGTLNYSDTMAFASQLILAAELCRKLTAYLETQIPAWNELLQRKEAVRLANKKLWTDAVDSAHRVAKQFATKNVATIDEGETFLTIVKHYLLYGTYINREQIVNRQENFSKNYVNKLKKSGLIVETGSGENWSVAPSPEFLEKNDLHSLNVKLDWRGEPKF